MESILQQSPEGTSPEQIERLYKLHNGNVADILSEVWNIQEKVKNVPNDMNKANKEKWNEIRDICNAYEEEMQKMMEKMRNQN